MAAASAVQWEEGESVAYPKHLGRSVFVLSGSWDFAFLGDVDLSTAAAVREEDLRRSIDVPDAFDQREWLCPSAQAGVRACAGGGEWPCGRCCEVSRGPRGDEQCWQEANDQSFAKCCDPVAVGRRGVAAYRTWLPAEVALLHFRACSMFCTVYIDRVLVAEHAGGYSPFWVHLPEHVLSHASAAGGGALELLVLADNRFLPDWPVHQPYFDWYQPGGLLREVEAHALRARELFFEGVEMRPRRPAGEVDVRLRFSPGCLGRGLRVSLAFDGAGGDSAGAAAAWWFAAARARAEDSWPLGVPNPRIWSPSSPELHVLTATLWQGTVVVDKVEVRFGIRVVEIGNGQILLNGEPLTLLGVNRHENHPHGGIWMAPEDLRRDLALLRELGANFVRGAHYSQDQRWLDLCDEAGFLVWEETMGWQPRLEHLEDPIFMQQQLSALEETINVSANHPSIIMWGFLNEGQSDSYAARPSYELLAQRARVLDPTRLVSWASKTKLRDMTLDLADVISFNDYPGWYDAAVEEIPSVWRSYVEWARAHFPGKPFLMSEVGASGIAGFRSPAELGKWSEDLQATMLQASIMSMQALSVAGIALWQFADNRVDTAVFFQDNPRASPLANVSDADWVERVAIEYETTNSPFGSHLPLRPRRVNNKGLLSLDRHYRKEAFRVARDAFRGLSCSSSSSPGAGVWPSSGTTAPPGRWLQGPVRLVATAAAGRCHGCFLAVHTWNAGDRPEGEPGLRVHAHAREARASHWTLEPGGLLRLVGHTDGRPAAVGWYVSVAVLDGVAVVVREAAGALWEAEPAAGGVEALLLRVSFGPGCGSYLSLPAGSDLGAQRDESSEFVTAQRERAAATVWRILPAA